MRRLKIIQPVHKWLQNYKMIPLGVTNGFFTALFMAIKYQIIFSLKYSKIECVCVHCLCTVGSEYVTSKEVVCTRMESLSRQVVLLQIFVKLCYIECIPLIRRHNHDSHRINRNMLLKNSVIWLNIFIKIHFFFGLSYKYKIPQNFGIFLHNSNEFLTSATPLPATHISQEKIRQSNGT